MKSPFLSPAERGDGCLITFVVIGRNEEDAIADCLESVLQTARLLPSWECIYVDSASQDDTVKRVLALPVAVIRLGEHQLLSAALGRYVGTLHATGRYVMYVDGDCLLQAGFVEKGVAALEDDDLLAGVVGTRGKSFGRGDARGEEQGARPSVVWDNARDCEVVATGGVGLFRRACVEQVGGYNGFMRANEERDLCLRLKRAGFRIRCIPHPMMVHMSHDSQHGLSYRELLRRLRCGLLEGPGQLLRRSLHDRRFTREYLEKGSDRILGFLAWLLLGGVLAGVSLIRAEYSWCMLWLAASFGLFSLFLCRTRSLKRTLYYTVASFLQAIGLVRGFLRGFGNGKPCSPAYEILKVCGGTVQEEVCARTSGVIGLEGLSSDAGN